MADAITQGGSSVSFTRILGYKADRESQTIVHTVLGNAIPDATLRAGKKRSGTLELGFHGASSETNSKSAADLLSNTSGSYQITSTDRTSINMTFVVIGAVERELEDESRDAWILRFGFQEIS